MLAVLVKVVYAPKTVLVAANDSCSTLLTQNSWATFVDDAFVAAGIV
jgi:hypothetical protein